MSSAKSRPFCLDLNVLRCLHHLKGKIYEIQIKFVFLQKQLDTRSWQVCKPTEIQDN